jgi:hypothetical protein
MVIEVPKRTPLRYKWISDRVFKIDLRGIKNPIRGNPNRDNKRKFNSPEHLKALCDEYFSSCTGVLYNHKTGLPYINKDGTPLIGQIKPYTISGLALYLDIDTNALKRYEKGIRDDIGFDVDETRQYSTILKRARQRIEEYAEGRLYDRDGSNGAKFVLDNAFNWVSQKEQAEIENLRETRRLKEQEFKLKRELIDGESSDNEIKITISRKGREDD